MPKESDQLPQPPTWATRSVPEDGGVIHELVSTVHPVDVGGIADLPTDPRETDIALSVIDRPGPGGWLRAETLVLVEGGKFTLTEARRLRQALDELLSRAGTARP